MTGGFGKDETDREGADQDRPGVLARESSSAAPPSSEGFSGVPHLIGQFLGSLLNLANNIGHVACDIRLRDHGRVLPVFEFT
jgi:hypothetical protein